jgi:hypothetical protein
MYTVVVAYHMKGWKTLTFSMDGSKVTPVQIDIHSLHADILTVSKQELCAKYLGLSYIEEQIPQNQIFVVAYNDKTPIGYVMASYLPKGGVYLDVICALERKGPALLSLFLQVCQEQIGASYIQLSSLMHVLTFYPKYGFSHRRSCDEPPNIAMSPELSAYILDKMRAGVLTSDEAFFDDPKIARFLQDLHRLGYTKTKNPISCQDTALSVGLQKQRRCSKDGYTMIKCLGESTVPPATHIVPFEDYARTAPRSTKPSRELQHLLTNLSLSHRRTSKSKKKGTPGIATRSLRSRGTGVNRGTRSTKRIRLKSIREE